MKLRVVGWVYPYYNIEIGEASWAVRNAIIDEIRKNGYDFSGRSHQDYCCTPVLNNGKKYLFSSEGWGDIMAEANGHTGCMDYTMYDFPIEPRREKMPNSDANEFDMFLYTDEYDFEQDFEDWFADFIDQSEETRKELKESYRREQRWLVAEPNLNERFELKVTKEALDSASSTGKIVLPVLPELRYLDAGDTLALTCGGGAKDFTVAEVVRKRDLSAERLLELQIEMSNINDRKQAKEAKDEIDCANMVLEVKLKK